jgi:hypothetical protein
VSTLAGAKAGLASERSYTARTLPAGIVRGVLDAARGDVAGFGRALLIIAGLALTSAGYLAGMVRRRPLIDGEDRA